MSNANPLGLSPNMNQSYDDPIVKTREPSPRALMLLETFSNRDKITNPKLKFARFTGIEFLREYHDADASVETIRGYELGTAWTYTFVTNKKTGFLYVRASQDGTQIVNHYQRCISSGVEPEINWQETTDNNIFIKGTGQFDFSSDNFLKFYTMLDKALLGNHDVSHTPFIITIQGQKNLLNSQRANTIKEDLIKRGAKGMNITIEFGGQAESPIIKIRTNFVL